MVTKTKANKKTTATALGLVQVSLIPAQAEVERMVEYFKADMGFKDIRITVNLEKQGSHQCYGHFTEGEVYESLIGERGSYELKISSEHLNRSALQIATTVRHELIHAKNIEDGIKDTSNNGIYHNAKFLACASQYGLEMREKTAKNGYGLTKGFAPIYEAEVVNVLQPDDGAFTLARKVIEAKKKNKAPTKMLKWACECGVNVRCAVDLNATCNECGTDFVRDSAEDLIHELLRA